MSPTEELSSSLILRHVLVGVPKKTPLRILIPGVVTVRRGRSPASTKGIAWYFSPHAVELMPLPDSRVFFRKVVDSAIKSKIAAQSKKEGAVRSQWSDPAGRP